MGKNLNSKRTIDGHTFTFNEEYDTYECRGRVCYDDEHDEIPEPSLWAAAEKLANMLKDEGFGTAYREHSEKGWVEVRINS